MSTELAFFVAIPARYGSTRLPGKPLRLIAGEPMIRHVARRALATGAAEVVIVTDDVRIGEALNDIQVRVCMTSAEHASGSDRLAECVEQLGWPDEAIVVNLQGDEPLAPASGVRAVAAALAQTDAPMATLATPIMSAIELFDANCVKVVCDVFGRASYFSRAPIPYARDAFAQDRHALPAGKTFLRHIGIYAYRAGFLRQFTALPHTPCEQLEALEQLRVLEHGYSITVRLAPEPFPPGVDTEEDLLRAERLLQAVS